jgi:hypothetical protein
MSGNIAQIPAVADFLEALLQTFGVFPTALVSSQIISNVPSAILLSHFTNDWAAVALGTNIGAVGTPISSMATLITLRQYQKERAGIERKVRGEVRGVQFRLFRCGFCISDVCGGDRLTQPARPIRNRQKTVLRLRKPRCTDSSPLLRKRAASRQSYKTVRAIR